MKCTLMVLLMVMVRSTSLMAQDDEGKLTDKTNGSFDAVNYSYSTNEINGYHTVYKVKDQTKAKKLIYTVDVSNNAEKATLQILVTDDKNNPVLDKQYPYDPKKCGLIFNDNGALDTAINLVMDYKYLLSFTDVPLTFPYLHKVAISKNLVLELDPLPNGRVKRHKDKVVSLLANTAASAEASRYEKENVEAEKRNEARRSDSMRAVFTRDSLRIVAQAQADAQAKIAKQKEEDERKAREPYDLLNKDLKEKARLMYWQYKKDSTEMMVKYGEVIALKNNTEKPAGYKDINHNKGRYIGQADKHTPKGNGLAIYDNGNGNAAFYYGTFDDLFLSGFAFIREGNGDYYGKFSDKSKNGTGMMKYKTGEFKIGTFKDNQFQQGVIYEVTPGKVETFFGTVDNYTFRNGYGEATTAAGDSLFGIFVNGRFTTGYKKQRDTLGVTTLYYVVDTHGVSIEDALAKDFFVALDKIRRGKLDH